MTKSADDSPRVAGESHRSRTKLKTMEDLARAVGLSRPTVSRYFSDPSSVRASTRRKIERALEEYDYTPNLLAMNLNRRKTRVIGIVVPEINDPFFTSLIRIVELFALERGYQVLSECGHGDVGLEVRAIENLASMNAAGVIIAPLGIDEDMSRLHRVRELMPHVFVDSRLDNETAYVGTNNGQSIGLIVEYLCRSGSPPAFFTMPAVNYNGIEREKAYLDKMHQLGHEPRIVNEGKHYTGWDFEQYGHRTMLDLIDSRRLDAGTILCANDRLAFGVLSAAFKRGVPVGRAPDCELRVAGHDDQPLSRFSCPALTTVAQDVEAIGVEAVRILLDKVAGDQGGGADHEVEKLFEAKLMLRDSA
jgi:DNA-binding LacI/PurR family transcriptional regulator